MWNNTRDYIQNSFSNIGSIFRRDRSNNLIDLDFNFRRRSTIRRSNRRTNRTNCLSRNSSRTLAFNSQLNRELLNASSSTATTASTANQIIRPPHIHRTRSCHSNNSSLSNPNSNLSSPNSAHSFQPLLPTETINSFNQTASNSLSSPQPPPSTRSLSPLLPVINPHYSIIRTPLSPQNVFNQHYLRTFSPRNFCNLNGENQNLIQLTKEKNYLSCLINLLVIITIVISILQPRWFQIQGGICNNKYIGLQEFMFQQNNGQSLNKNTFQLNNNNLNSNDQKSNTAQDRPKINYFKLTDEIPNKINSSSNFEINKSSLNQITHNTTINLLNNYKKNHTYLITSTQSSIQNYPIHLPVYQAPTTQKSNINLFKNYDKTKRSNDESQIQFYKSLADHYQNQINDCLSPEVLGLQRLIIILCIFVIFSSLIQLLLDLIGSTNKYMNLLREHAIFNLISVIICIMIIGITYLLSNLLTKEQLQKHLLSNQNRPYYSTHHKLGHSSSINFFNLDKDDQHIEVRLEISYYLIIFAGVFSLVAAICNLFNNKPNLYLININSDQEANSLLNGDPHQVNNFWSNNQNFRGLVLNSQYFEAPPPYQEVVH